MANPLSQKTFKMEFEFTVAMDEVGEEHLGTWDADLDLVYLQQLQRALASDETALGQQMLGAALIKLQEYADYLAAQDNLAPLRQAAAGLDAEDMDLPERPRTSFFELTRPIRVSSMSARFTGATIHEQVAGIGEEIGWEPVWTDLRPDTEVGRLMEQYWIPTAPVPFLPRLESSHYLMTRYLSRQKDGVHLEARCTCETVIEGVGEDEAAALDQLWEHYQKHVERSTTAKRIQLGLKKYCLKG